MAKPKNMENESKKHLSEIYSDHFENFAEVAHPSIIFTPKFDALMKKAIDRGTPLTEKEVEAEFGELAWDW
jgi:hypothetical protein